MGEVVLMERVERGFDGLVGGDISWVVCGWVGEVGARRFGRMMVEWVNEEAWKGGRSSK